MYCSFRIYSSLLTPGSWTGHDTICGSLTISPLWFSYFPTELEICWLPASSESPRFCFAESVNHNIFITSPLPITSNVPLNLATLFAISVGSMNGREVICQRRNTKIEKEKGKKTQPSSCFYNPWGRQAEREVLPFPTTLIFFFSIYLFIIFLPIQNFDL